MSSKPLSVRPAADPHSRPQRDAEPEQAFERLIIELSLGVINASRETLDSAIETALACVGAHLGLGLATVLSLDRDKGVFLHTHEWYDPNLFDGSSFRGTAVEAPHDWVAARLIEGKDILLSTVGDLPAEALGERKTCETLGIRSVLWLPISRDQQLNGYLSFNSIGKETNWTEPIVRRIRLLAQIIGAALSRTWKESDLQNELAFEHMVGLLSAEVANVQAAELDTVLTHALRRLATFFGFERAFLTLRHGDRLFVDHVWFEEHLPARQREFQREQSPDKLWILRRCLEGRVVAIEKLEDLPAEAEFERQYYQEQGIQSSIFIPGRVGQEVVGLVVLDSMSKPKIWHEEAIRRLTFPIDVLFSSLMRIKAEQEVDRRLRFESLLADLSRRLAAIDPESVDAEIERWLAPIGDAIAAEQVVVGTLSNPDDPAAVRVLTWNSGDPLRSLTPDEAPWLVGELFEYGRMVCVETLDDLPLAAEVDRKSLESLGIRSFLSLPLKCGEEIYGGISLCSLSRERTWSHDLRAWLGLIGEAIAGTLARRHVKISLQEALNDSKRAQQSLGKALSEVEQLKSRLEEENISLRREIQKHANRIQIVGESTVLQRLLHDSTQVASTESTVLVQGETGTGKELLARFIHRSSRRAESPLVKVDCATLPETLVESELFGRERGAYTGAMTRQMGRFEVADGGTIFLDEIGELPAETQVKLLRVLEEGAFERLGSSKTVRVDVRVIAVTNRDLQAAVAARQFREDLFYRLNVFPLTVPPLRERLDDIPQLTWSFVQEFASTMGKEIEAISPQSLSALQAHDWPGNIRELRNVLERAMILSHGHILEVGGFGIAGRKDRMIEPGASLDEAQRQHILRTLAQTSWRVRGKAGAAEILQLKPTTLEARMKKLGIQRPS